MRCIVCGKTEEGVAEKCFEIAAQINKTLDNIDNQEERAALLQWKKKLDRISFTSVSVSGKAFNILAKYTDTKEANNSSDHLICMHCKALADNMRMRK